MNNNNINLKIVSNSYLLISWNVNGYSHDIHEWLKQFTKINNPDVIFLSETKKKREELEILFSQFTDYNYIINEHNPTRWHGVAMFIRKIHSYIRYDIIMNVATRSDSKSNEASVGRIIAINLNDIINIIGSYTPNSGRYHEKLDYRLTVWDPAFYKLLEIFRNYGHTIWMGDINVSLNEIDISNTKTLSKCAGFTIGERQNFYNILKDKNWYDIWRHQNPNEKKYTWCGTPRRLGYGMRLDNIIISSSLIDKQLKPFMVEECAASTDHIIVGTYITI